MTDEKELDQGLTIEEWGNIGIATIKETFKNSEAEIDHNITTGKTKVTINGYTPAENLTDQFGHFTIGDTEQIREIRNTNEKNYNKGLTTEPVNAFGGTYNTNGVGSKEYSNEFSKSGNHFGAMERNKNIDIGNAVATYYHVEPDGDLTTVSAGLEGATVQHYKNKLDINENIRVDDFQAGALYNAKENAGAINLSGKIPIHDKASLTTDLEYGHDFKQSGDFGKAAVGIEVENLINNKDVEIEGYYVKDRQNNETKGVKASIELNDNTDLFGYTEKKENEENTVGVGIKYKF